MSLCKKKKYFLDLCVRVCSTKIKENLYSLLCFSEHHASFAMPNRRQLDSKKKFGYKKEWFYFVKELTMYIAIER